MTKMTYIFLSLAVASLLIIAIVCSSCKNHGGVVLSKEMQSDTPADISTCNLIRYQYTESGSTQWPMYQEIVERCENDTTKCVVYIFDSSKSTNFDENGNAQMDTVVVGKEVLDHVKDLIIKSKAWKFKERYTPKYEIMDGWSWSMSATFDVSDSVLAATPKEKIARLKRHGGRSINSSGANARPETSLFQSVRNYLQQVIAANIESTGHTPL